MTFFGSARVLPGSAHYELAYQMAKIVASAGYTIITGGGPGVMEAANKGAFYGSILGILDHVLQGDTLWLRRYKSVFNSKSLESPLLEAEVLKVDQKLSRNAEEWFHQRDKLDSLFISFLEDIPEEKLLEKLEYTNFKGIAKSHFLWQAILHTFNHQTHHRGEVSVLLDQMGIANDYSNLHALL